MAKFMSWRRRVGETANGRTGEWAMGRNGRGQQGGGLSGLAHFESEIYGSTHLFTQESAVGRPACATIPPPNHGLASEARSTAFAGAPIRRCAHSPIRRFAGAPLCR
jgi:hypothetical protein